MSGLVVVLEVMWGSRGRHRAFRINPLNHSGARLIKLIGHDDFLVTNACPDPVPTAKGRSKPDAQWLRDNLRLLQPTAILVCGSVAQATFQPSMAQGARVLHLPHPAK